MFKRAFDFAFAFIGLALSSPFFLLIFLLIKIDSRGPGFYLQERIGRHGKIFRLFKFRTMRVNADRLQAITVGARDPRITTFGYFLRKFKVDELPQLINVLKGEMSLVGPRPELKKFVDLYSTEQRQVLSVRPGITDPASIKFRNENELLEGRENPIQYYTEVIMPQKLQMNLDYIRKRSVGYDVKLIFFTIFSIFSRRE
jgi:lipopolysaccharide/colanic/teichoic acid biosynthesis glycosyltransferase